MQGELEQVLAALADCGGRYLVVGGVAVVLQGHPRLTADLDLVLDLDPENVLIVLSALAALGYRPRAPVPLLEFASAERRATWLTEKGLTVFSLWSPTLPTAEIDVFVEEPFDFAAVFARADQVDLGFGAVSVIAVPDLIALKRQSARPKDLEDIRALLALLGSEPP